MNYEVAYHTDMGRVKEVNQDSLCIKHISSNGEEFVMALICDGMGGLAQGELASATVVRDFVNWFEDKFVRALDKVDFDEIMELWECLLHNANRKISEYGKKNGIQLGTTATILLLRGNGKYQIVHVGDTRLYYINENFIRQITEDQTFVAREVEQGRMTKEEAMVDARRNVLLQCIGAVESLRIKKYKGTFEENGYILLCSDGFRHQWSEKEMQDIYTYDIQKADKQYMKDYLCRASNVCMNRGENDNISAILIKLLRTEI